MTPPPGRDPAGARQTPTPAPSEPGATRRDTRAAGKTPARPVARPLARPLTSSTTSTTGTRRTRRTGRDQAPNRPDPTPRDKERAPEAAQAGGPRPGRAARARSARIAMMRPSRATTTRSPYLVTRTRRAPAPGPAGAQDRGQQETTPVTNPRLPATAQVYETHHLSVTEAAAAWADLVDWVTWLHDAYELSFAERLPLCWPKHPGLVRELAALRAWRAEIYTPRRHPATGEDLPVWGNGGSARAWHTELRNVLTAADTDYARGCRAGHRGAPTLLTGDDGNRTAWMEQQPPALLPRGTSQPPDRPPPPAREIDDATMRRLLATGGAQQISPALAGYLRHAGVWWVTGPDATWLEITSADVATRLDLVRAHWAKVPAGPAPRPR